MTTTGKPRDLPVSDQQLEWILAGTYGSYEMNAAGAQSMARELLAHRRASQAAPAPVAWQHVAASVQAHQIADGVASGRMDRLTAFVPYAALKAAPAPSDALREAINGLRSINVGCDEAGNAVHYVRRSEVLAALSTPTEEPK